MDDTAPRTVGSGLVRHKDLLVVREHIDPLIANGLDSLDAIFAAASGESLVKPRLDPWRERLRLFLEKPGPLEIVYAKRFSNPPRKTARQLKRAHCGAKSLAGLEWHWLRTFKQLGIPAAEPIAFGERLRGSRELRSAVLIAAVPGESLEKLARSLPAHAPADRALLSAVAKLVGRMHGLGLVHRDLYLSHFFFDAESGPESGLRLIDLQRVLRPTVLRTRWFVKDLAALNYSTPITLVSNTRRLRWLNEYLRQRDRTECRIGLPQSDSAERLRRMTRQWAYLIAGKTDRIARHDRNVSPSLPQGDKGR